MDYSVHYYSLNLIYYNFIDKFQIFMSLFTIIFYDYTKFIKNTLIYNIVLDAQKFMKITQN